MMLPENLDPQRLPAHVGIIMDGNGRWARQRSLNRSFGHREGLVATKRIVREAAQLGISYLSLFTFSTENWKRAEDEVNFLMSLVGQNLRREYDFYREHRIRIRYSGDLAGLPREVQADILAAMQETSRFDRLQVVLALNYGGRDEILRAVGRWLADPSADHSKTPDEAGLAARLDNPDIPEPDLIIRTAGEMRTSNFLLWESAYSELHFSSAFWPDFSPAHFHAALLDYQTRTRTYGGLA
jgi:undecaprenyl diphosphate synthase